MQFSAPIYVLKRKAKLLAREADVPLHQALDELATQEGYRSWSHLASSPENVSPVREILGLLEPGDLCLVAARPGQGKTLLGLELAAKASRIGRQGYFFTLDFHEQDVADRLMSLGIDPNSTDSEVVIDTSDDVSADYVIDRLSTANTPALIVLDYLQLLDQKRKNPSLSDQMASLQRFVDDTGAICVVVSQIDRAFDLGGKSMPDASDVRLPNPLDLSVFSKFFFLHQGKFQFDRVA